MSNENKFHTRLNKASRFLTDRLRGDGDESVKFSDVRRAMETNVRNALTEYHNTD